MSYRFLWSRPWVILTLVALALVPSMIRLGFWQLHRHEHRVANNKLIADSLAVATTPVERLSRPGGAVRRADTWRSVTASGRYDTAHEVVARQRTAADGSRIGYYVITPLVLSDGGALLVNRGWVAPGDDITVFPKVPKAPSGVVTVTGRLRPDETTASSGIRDRRGLPRRQIMLINGHQFAGELPQPLLGGYLELVKTSPGASGPQPQLVPEPDHNDIGPHMAYAIQWWLFAAMVPVGWVILFRRERRDQGAGAAPWTAPGAAAGGPPGPSADQGRAVNSHDGATGTANGTGGPNGGTLPLSSPVLNDTDSAEGAPHDETGQADVEGAALRPAHGGRSRS